MTNLVQGILVHIAMAGVVTRLGKYDTRARPVGLARGRARSGVRKD
ncbi:hypothetical protein MTX20_35185 [Bradyrhizobium sp. ISRA435]|nr:hypothetical protein MTX20_35185 [Bradyrhizobium sp. ISRA435]